MAGKNISQTDISLPENIHLHARGEADETAIFALEQSLFGPGRFARAAYQLRRGVEAFAPTSVVAKNEAQEVVGSAGTTLIEAEGQRGVLLGPLVTHPDYQNQGIGRSLVNEVVTRARNYDADDTGALDYVILVGDYAYYIPCGFKQVPPAQLHLGVPVDPARLLCVCLHNKSMPRGRVTAIVGE